MFRLLRLFEHYTFVHYHEKLNFYIHTESSQKHRSRNLHTSEMYSIVVCFVFQLHTKTSKVLTDLKDERQMNSSLQENQKSWQERVTNLEKQLETKDRVNI